MNALLLDRAQLSLPELSALASQPNPPSTPPEINEPLQPPTPPFSPDEQPITDPHPYPAPDDDPLPPPVPQPEPPAPIVFASRRERRQAAPG